MKLPLFNQAKILVVGDVMLDRYCFGQAARISPEAPVPVVHITDHDERPGGAANVALNSAALGAQIYLLGLCGEDEAGAQLIHGLEQAGVQQHLIALSDRPTITKSRIVALHQQLLRFDQETPFSDTQSSRLMPQLEQLIQRVDVIILSDYGKGTLSQAIIQRALQATVPVLVDPKGDDFSRYQGATLLTPNRHEFEQVAGVCSDEQALVEKGAAIIEAYHLGGLLITRGADGMTLLQAKDGSCCHLSAQQHDVFDVTGAGDTVISVLACALAAGSDLVTATKLANLAAGLAVTKLGSVAMTPSELQGLLQPEPSCIVTQETAYHAVRAAQKSGEQVVMTNGCFDLLHAGHVRYLKQASALGDRLLVAVNDDSGVRELKGLDRPVNPLEQRMEVLAALACVDWVVSFSDPTPERLVAMLSPDRLVKGGDYNPNDMAGSAYMRSLKRHVDVLPFVDGCSTTAMINRIKEASL